MKEIREFENQEQTERSRLETVKTNSKPLEKAQSTLEPGANRSTGTRVLGNKEQPARDQSFGGQGAKTLERA